MKKIGFVIPWYGPDIPGGAEAALRGLVEHLHAAGVEVEVISTCVKEFKSDWSANYYREGVELVNNVPVRRFKAKKRAAKVFEEINYRFMNNLPVSYADEEKFLEEMVNSPDLYKYLGEYRGEYSLFVFTPYMFGTTYYGVQKVLDKAVMIPCFHKESYAYMEHFKEVFSRVKGMIFLAEPEKILAEEIYDTSGIKKAVLGTGIYTDTTGDAERFKLKYNIDKPFILYAGRKDKGKNIDTLLAYYREYVRRGNSDLQLVLIGGGSVDIPKDIKEKVHDLGFVPFQDKFDAYAAAYALCNPSHNESFSIVIMESWLCERPVLVSADCGVTKNFAIEASGGLYFKNYFEFEGSLNYLLAHGGTADIMGKNGREYVLKHFSWDAIVENYMRFFREAAGEV